MLIAISDVVVKYLIEFKYCSVYELSIYSGIINSILFGLLQLFDYFFFDMDDLNKYFNEFCTTELLVMLGFIIIQLGIYLCGLITNKNYTPCHIFIIVVFGQLGYYLDFSANSIGSIICFIFILFMSLIFNEIIEINFCGLSKYTRRNIIKRSENESNSLENNLRLTSFDENAENDIIPDSSIELEHKK